MSQIVLQLVTTGTTFPINIYVSDVYGNNSTLVQTIASGPIPPEVYITLPQIFNNAPQIMVTLVDANNCVVFHILSPTSLPSTTPTPTPTLGLTATPTSTNTPTPTPTATIGLTPTATPSTTPTTTPTETIGVTPTTTPTATSGLYYAYLFPEPQDSTSLVSLGDYMATNGASYFFGYGNSGAPNINDYSNDLNVYAHYSGFTLGGGSKFVTPVSNLSSLIRTASGVGPDSFGCDIQQYTFGTIKVGSNNVNPNETYFYSIWIPTDPIPIAWNNMTVNIGRNECSQTITSDTVPSPSLSTEIVTVTTGAAIPAGTYRVLWMPFSGYITPEMALSYPLYFKAENLII
jgi:hypothetical protein